MWTAVFSGKCSLSSHATLPSKGSPQASIELWKWVSATMLARLQACVERLSGVGYDKTLLKHRRKDLKSYAIGVNRIKIFSQWGNCPTWHIPFSQTAAQNFARGKCAHLQHSLWTKDCSSVSDLAECYRSEQRYFRVLLQEVLRSPESGSAKRGQWYFLASART